MDLSRLLKFGYFPKELPPTFTTNAFGTFALEEGFPEVKSTYVSRPCTHNLARPGNNRRVLSIPNPFNYYLLCKLLSENKLEVKKCLKRSNISVSKPIVDQNDYRAFIPEDDGKELPAKRAANRAVSRFILRADISRFYHSIYTHSIPWAILGKRVAKAAQSGGFANELDRLLRNGQDRQTLGIPVGPDASFIVAEILCCAIDHMLQAKKFKGFRFIDDFEFTFLTRSEAEIALPTLESILQEFELGLNPLKSQIDELPILLENSWRLKSKNYTFYGSVSSSQLLEYFDLLFELHNDNKTEGVLRYGIARLRSCEFDEPEILLDLLFQCVLIEPGTLRETLYLIEMLGLEVNKGTLSDVVHDLISVHGSMKHGSEIAWALWAAIYFRIKISDEVVKNLEFIDSPTALITLHAIQKKLISKKVKKNFEHLMTKASLTDGNWLLAYEADLKGWLPSIDGQNHIDSDEHFKVLKANNISFYDTDIDYLVSKAEVNDSYDPDGDEEEDQDQDEELEF